MEINEMVIRITIWNKGIIDQKYDQNMVRRDRFGSLIVFSEYGMLTEFGWEYDHTIPRVLNGSDSLINIQPLHWRNNRAKGSKLI